MEERQDTISRQAALDALLQCRKHCIDPFDSYRIDIEDAEARIRRVPAARRAAKPTVMPLICLRCKKDIPLTFDTFAEVSYTHYSYCEDCLRKGLALLKAKDKEENNEQRD